MPVQLTCRPDKPSVEAAVGRLIGVNTPTKFAVVYNNRFKAGAYTRPRFGSTLALSVG